MLRAGEPLPSREEAIKETKRRLVIIERLVPSLGDMPQGVLLGGSMAWGRNIAVRGSSDMDISIFCPADRLDSLASTEFLDGKISEIARKSFRDGAIDVIWPKLEIDGIPVNIFIHNPSSHMAYCRLERQINAFTTAFKPDGRLFGYGFDGILRTINVEVSRLGDGYVYPRPLFCNNEFYGNPIRGDYLYCSMPLMERDGFIQEAEREFWKSSVRQLLKEYPNPDLSVTNVLNTSLILNTNPEALPKGIVEKTITRTESELSSIGIDILSLRRGSGRSGKGAHKSKNPAIE